MANDDVLRIKEIEDLNVHEMHVFLAHKKDRNELEAHLRKPKGSNTVEL